MNSTLVILASNVVRGQDYAFLLVSISVELIIFLYF